MKLIRRFVSRNCCWIRYCWLYTDNDSIHLECVEKFGKHIENYAGVMVNTSASLKSTVVYGYDGNPDDNIIGDSKLFKDVTIPISILTDIAPKVWEYFSNWDVGGYQTFKYLMNLLKPYLEFEDNI